MVKIIWDAKLANYPNHAESVQYMVKQQRQIYAGSHGLNTSHIIAHIHIMPKVPLHKTVERNSNDCNINNQNNLI